MKAAVKAVTTAKITATPATVAATVPDGNLFRILTPALWNPMPWNSMH
jgi:hypothetical protein